MKFYTKILIFITLFIALIMEFSCSNKEEKIPAYIVIDSVELKTDIKEEGSNSHNLCDSWIYVGGKLIGDFENLHKNIPVLENGRKTIEINPGIKENSSNSLRVDYTMLTSYKIDTILTPGEILHLTPQYKYFDDVKFPLIEDFDRSGSAFTISEGSVPMRIVQNETSFEKKSACFTMKDENDAFEIKTNNLLTLPKGGYDCYLEINYKCNAYFSFGFFDHYNTSDGNIVETRTEVFTFKPSDNQWKKLYVNLKTHLKKTNGISFRPFFASTKKANPDVQEALIYIDNIKILYK